LRDPNFSRFDTIPDCDRHTHRQTYDDDIYRLSIASRGKNATVNDRNSGTERFPGLSLKVKANTATM